MINKALEHWPNLISPRAKAYSIVGLSFIHPTVEVTPLIDKLSSSLVELYHQNKDGDWHWFEDTVSYANAKLPHALILSGRCMDNADLLNLGLKALRWLVKIQTSDVGSFRPIGSNGFYVRGKNRALFDQQPVEAHATVSACIEAYQATNDMFWVAEARRAFEWFLGRNDLGLALYDSTTGGCRDGLHMDRLSQNHGAESTLAFLLALTEMQALQNTLTSFKEPAGA